MTCSFTYDALCIWEELLEAKEGSYPGYEAYREVNGVSETRDRVFGMAQYADPIWTVARANGFDAPFDFEFVPLFLKYCTSACDEGSDFRFKYKGTRRYIETLGKLIGLIWRAKDIEALARQSLRSMTGETAAFFEPERIEAMFRSGACPECGSVGCCQS